MKKLEVESYALVAMQFLSAGLLIYLTIHIELTLAAVIMITASIAIGLWAMLTMRIGNFRVNPIPKEKGKLVTTGPYGFIRHPMYTAVLLAMLGIAININSLTGYCAWIVLLLDLIIKMRLEEKLLAGKFPEYSVYLKRTKKVLPWIW